MNENQLALSPEQAALKAELESLRKEFIKLYTEKDRMMTLDRDDLTIKYLNLIGREKYENFSLSVEVRALKMKVELAQAYLNRNERPNMYAIEQEVKRCLSEYNRMLQEQADAIKAAQEAAQLSEFNLAEEQQLYRLLVKRLHPDLHPGMSDDMKDLFLQAQTAYRSHNLNLLRQMVLRLDMDGGVDELLEQAESTEEAVARLKKQVAELKADIERLQGEFPFSIRMNLQDPAWVKEQRDRLLAEREQLQEEQKKYSERLELICESV